MEDGFYSECPECGWRENILSAAAIILMIGIIAAVTSEMYIASGILLICLAICVRLSAKKYEKRK